MIMKPMNDKALVSGGNNPIFLWRKQDDNAILPLKTQLTVSCTDSLSSSKLIVRNYHNFMTSGLPRQVLFYQDSKWENFPDAITLCAHKDFQMKRSISEVTHQNQHLLLDFVHMVYIDKDTGSSNPIAWIDVHDAYFFPEICASHEKNVHMPCEPNGTQETIGHFDISHGIAESSNFETCDAKTASKCYKKNISTCNKFRSDSKNVAGNKDVIGALGNSNAHAELEEAVGENEPLEVLPEEVPQPAAGPDIIGAVKNLLLNGAGSHIREQDIVDVAKISSADTDFGRVRYELFRNQLEATKKLRGNANMRYAWLASSKQTAEDIMLHGVFKIKRNMGTHGPILGDAIILSPTNCSNLCVSCSDIDENGLVHIMLCRIVMGNVELVHSGSKQFQPSHSNFDSGVDDLQSPKNYIIWHRNKDTNIFPEFVVSIKVLRQIESPTRKLDLSNESVVTNSGSSDSLLQADPSAILANQSEEKAAPVFEKAPMFGRAPKSPSSPWMPFSMLFASISTKVSAQDMDMINIHYEDFKRKRMKRMDLVMKLRQLVGDKLLVSTITRLQQKLPKVSTVGGTKSFSKNFCEP